MKNKPTHRKNEQRPRLPDRAGGESVQAATADLKGGQDGAHPGRVLNRERGLVFLDAAGRQEDAYRK